MRSAVSGNPKGTDRGDVEDDTPADRGHVPASGPATVERPAEIDIEQVPGAAEEVMRNVGKRAIPQFVIDGKWVQPYRPGFGFLRQEMSELFGVPV